MRCGHCLEHHDTVHEVRRCAEEHEFQSGRRGLDGSPSNDTPARLIDQTKAGWPDAGRLPSSSRLDRIDATRRRIEALFTDAIVDHKQHQPVANADTRWADLLPRLGELAPKDFVQIWVRRWGHREWTEADRRLIVEICRKHTVGNIKSSIRSERDVLAIKDRCEALRSGRNPRGWGFQDGAWLRTHVRARRPGPNEWDKKSGVQNYQDDT